MIPHVTDVPGHPDPDFKSTLIFYSFFINWFPFPLFGKNLLIINVTLRDHSSEKNFQACFYIPTICSKYQNLSWNTLYANRQVNLLNTIWNSHF